MISKSKARHVVGEHVLPAPELSSLVLPAQKIDLWWIPVPDRSVQELLDAFGDVLSIEERHRFESQRLRKGQLQFLITRLTLRYLLSAYHSDIKPPQWRILKSGTGRPCVDRSQSSIEFNLTHTDRHLLIAFTLAGEPGLDAEQSGRSIDAIQVASRYFSNDETHEIAGSGLDCQNDLFLRFWTLKEAAVKATGQGLSVALRRFSFQKPTNKIFSYYDSQKTRNPCGEVFKFWSSILDNVVLGVCLKQHSANCNEQLKIESRKLVWPTASTIGQVSELEIQWNESKQS